MNLKKIRTMTNELKVMAGAETEELQDISDQEAFLITGGEVMGINQLLDVLPIEVQSSVTSRILIDYPLKLAQ